MDLITCTFLHYTVHQWWCVGGFQWFDVDPLAVYRNIHPAKYMNIFYLIMSM